MSKAQKMRRQAKFDSRQGERVWRKKPNQNESSKGNIVVDAYNPDDWVMGGIHNGCESASMMTHDESIIYPVSGALKDIAAYVGNHLLTQHPEFVAVLVGNSRHGFAATVKRRNLTDYEKRQVVQSSIEILKHIESQKTGVAR